MTQTQRVLIASVAAIALVVVGWTAVIGTYFVWHGVATVQFQEHSGSRISVPIPMALLHAAATTGGWVAGSPTEHLEIEISRSLGHDFDFGEWRPLVRDLLEVLEDCPDATLVEVEDGADHVRIAKEGRHLRIMVSDSEVDLKISVPVRSVTRTAARLMG